MNENKENNHPFRRTFFGAVFLGIFICVVGLSFNTFQKNRIPLDPKKMQVQSELKQGEIQKPDCEPYPIFIDHAKEIFDAGTAIFIDSRIASEFKEGHITGAINIPVDMVIYSFRDLQDQLPLDSVYVVYCGGGGCDIAYEVARFFCSNGYKDGNIMVYEDGYEPWVEVGYPFEK